MRYIKSAIVSISVCLGLFFYGMYIDNFAFKFTGLMLALPMAAITSTIEDYFINKFPKDKTNK